MFTGQRWCNFANMLW